MATKLFTFLLAVAISCELSAFQEICQQDDVQTIRCNYIPKDVPVGTRRVYLTNFVKKNEDFHIVSSTFRSDHWKNVNYLELRIKDYVSLNLESRCFIGLICLLELHIHIERSVTLDPDTFVGLDTVKSLDMSGCTRLALRKLLPSLNGQNKLPALESLKLSRLYMYYRPINFDKNFFKVLKDKRIKHLDLSNTKISEINATAGLEYLKDLKVFNLSYSTSVSFIIDKSVINRVQDIDVLDISHMPLTMPAGKFVLVNESWQFSQFNLVGKYFFAAKVMNISAIFPEFIKIWIKNCTLVIDEPINSTSQQLIGRQNNIKRVDATMLCNKYKIVSIKYLDLAENGLEFLHPSILSCKPNLESLDLSSNQLFKMVQEKYDLFGRLFSSVKFLKFINLSYKSLYKIPPTLFQQNHALENINLSHNQLQQVTFSIKHLLKLQILDLRYNNIRNFDANSLSNIDFKGGNIHTITGAQILLQHNPISCSKCSDKPFLQWLRNTNIEKELNCITETGPQMEISAATIKLVRDICKKKTNLISTSVASGVTTLVLITVLLVIYKTRVRWKRKNQLLKYLEMLNEGQGEYEFVAFLSYSSEDTDFVEQYVKRQLNENLQYKTRVDRDLVCTGDRYFRPGFNILDETVRCMERASVVISVVSNEYCESRYCHNELDQAYRLNKPIILMIKDHVDEHIMMPTMKMLFKNNVRILWTFENNEFVLKTTWENVCSSILDLIATNI